MNTQIGQGLAVLFAINNLVMLLRYWFLGYTPQAIQIIVALLCPAIAFIYESYWYNKNFKKD